MAYTNAIFYLDFAVTGGTSGDGVRATLTGVVFSNPSGTTVLGTYVGHGLVTGAVIDVTGCTQAYANSAWKITRVNDDTFTLDGGLWASFTGADVTGNAVPRGGQSWADAWKTIATGVTAARHAAGDIIRIAKSPDPVSLTQNAQWTGTTLVGGGMPATKAILTPGCINNGSGAIRVHVHTHGYSTNDVIQILAVVGTVEANGTWLITYVDADNFDLQESVFANAWVSGGTTRKINSKAVVLTTAINQTICKCEYNWSPANDGTPSLLNTDAKKGYNSIKILMDAATQTNKLQSYWATGTIIAATIGAFQKISFWFKNEAVIADETTWYLALCSDTSGATAVDLFPIPAIASYGQWIPFTLARTGGGNLGNGATEDIKSIAIYSGATAPTASKYVLIDNVIACTTNGLNLQSLISKETTVRGTTEGWYGIQSIDGRIILLDNENATKSNAGRGYSGTTESVPTYIRETVKTPLANASAANGQLTTRSGTLGNTIQYQFGYDTSTTEQNGATFLDGLSGWGYGIYVNNSYLVMDYFGVYRYSQGLRNNGDSGSYPNIIGAGNTSNYGLVMIGSLCTYNNIGWVTNGGVTYGLYEGGYQNYYGDIKGVCNNTGDGIVTITTSSVSSCFNTIGSASNNCDFGIAVAGSSTKFNLIDKLEYNTISGFYHYGDGSNCIVGRINYIRYNMTYAIHQISRAICEIGYIGVSIGNGTVFAYVGVGAFKIALVGSLSETTIASYDDPYNTDICIGIGQLGTTNGRWYRGHKYGNASDQITGGQNATWAYGGSGLCQYLNPISTSYYLPEVFYIPCTANAPVQCHFYVKKTSAAANCALTFSATGMDITQIIESSVTLTDSWAEYTSASMTSSYDGFIRIELRAKDGSTTGDIGIDDIHSVNV